MKKILLFASIALMLVTFTACSKANEQQENPTDTPATGTPSPTAPADQEGNTDNNTKTDAIDDVAILDVQSAVADLSGIEFGKALMSEEISDKEMAGFVLGYEGFNREFDAACHLAPMMSSSAFELAFFRPAAGEDIQAFAEEIRTKADSRKWVCVAADVVKTAIRGNTILFVMSDEHTADALINAFQSYDPATYVPSVDENALSGKTMEDVYYNLLSACGFLENAADGSYTDTAKDKLGFAKVDLSACEDIYADYSTEEWAHRYAVGFFRAPAEANITDLCITIDENADASAYGEGADFTIYYDTDENVIAYCISNTDIITAFQDGIQYLFPDMLCYR